jgi:hypothetical protein
MTARELGSESVDSRSVVMALRSPIALATRALDEVRVLRDGDTRECPIVIAAREPMSVKADCGCRAGCFREWGRGRIDRLQAYVRGVPGAIP